MEKLFRIFVLAILLILSQGLQAGSNGEHQVYKHHLAVFAGAASNLDAKHTDFSLGADYEFRLPIWHNKIGIGLFGEIVFAEHKETLYGLPIFIHPFGSFKFLIAPGRAIGEADGHSFSHSLWRVGCGYDFHLDNFSVTPTFDADFIEGHATLVYGISFGMGF